MLLATCVCEMQLTVCFVQVIDIVTLGQGQKGGGLFPNGLNGFFGPADQETEQ